MVDLEKKRTIDGRGEKSTIMSWKHPPIDSVELTCTPRHMGRLREKTTRKTTRGSWTISRRTIRVLASFITLAPLSVSKRIKRWLQLYSKYCAQPAFSFSHVRYVDFSRRQPLLMNLVRVYKVRNFSVLLLIICLVPRSALNLFQRNSNISKVDSSSNATQYFYLHYNFFNLGTRYIYIYISYKSKLVYR